MSAKFGYRCCGSSYRTTQNIQYGECATDESFYVRWPIVAKTMPFFTKMSTYGTKFSTFRMPDLLAADLSHFWTNLSTSANTGTHTHTI